MGERSSCRISLPVAYADDPRARAIAVAACVLNDQREAWLNPPDLVERLAEVVPGFPDRILPRTPAAAKVLAKRTLTNLYNERPTWLANAHAALDAAVATAYGWPADIAEEEALSRLLALNQARAGGQDALSAEPLQKGGFQGPFGLWWGVQRGKAPLAGFRGGAPV